MFELSSKAADQLFDVANLIGIIGSIIVLAATFTSMKVDRVRDKYADERQTGAALQQPIRLTISLRQPAPYSFFRKEKGAPTAAAAQLVQGFVAFPLLTIGVTNTEVTSNSDADDGAADLGMDCT